MLSQFSENILRSLNSDFEAILRDAIFVAEREGLVVQITRGLELGNFYHASGAAVDVLINDGMNYYDYLCFSEIVKLVGMDHEYVITWGGDWKLTPDIRHFQLERRVSQYFYGTEDID